MDLSNLKLGDAGSQKMELVHPVEGTTLLDDDKEPVTIELYGADSDVFRKTIRALGNKALSKNQKKRTIEELEESTVKLLARVTVGWSGLKEDGEELEFSIANAERLYTDYPWIKEQVDEFVQERSNFLTNA